MFISFISKLDIFLKRYPKYSHVICVFFDWSSRVTHFFLFNPAVFFFLYFLIPLVIAKHFLEIHEFNQDLWHRGVAHFFESYKNHIGPQLTCLFLFLFGLIELVIVNTILCTTNTVTTYMKAKYGEKILKERGYNAPGASTVRAAALAGTAIMSIGISATREAMIALENIKQQGITDRQAIESDERKFMDYLDHLKDKPDSNVQPPQPAYTCNKTIGHKM
jgi:hypothetical protein